ncbi:MAG: hypothetical protein HWN68_03650 [Desulfobacterales bacterium]|nr:hypothetical protein [Desulfobacterales bacterium]
MFEGINTLGKMNQNNLEPVQGQAEVVYESTQDVVEGKVNPVESATNMADESSLTDEALSQNKLNRNSSEGCIIDMLG